MDNLLFKTPAGIQLSPEQVVTEIIQFMQADTKRPYKIIIGTDSEEIGNLSADFVTAIVVHRIGNGGRYFWRRAIIGKMHTLRNRIWQEVLTSLDVAKDFLGVAKQFNLPHFDFEIHIDVGENGKTRDMIQELVGVIRANNFEARTKPYSYAASSVADRHNNKHSIPSSS
ncbi:MAG: ribonuclease H-like YkuK family protein [Patescibacteria group bacterium]